jgi:hypothetical protein
MTWDLYPVLEREFADPNVTSIDVRRGDGTGPIVRRITRAEFERERIERDVRTLTAPIARTH